MFYRNLQRLGNLLIPYFAINSSKSLRSIGRVCLIILPLKRLQPSLVYCYSTKSKESTLNKSESTSDDMAGNENWSKAASIYDFTVKDTYGNEVSLDKYKGYVVLIVNIASKCGLTKDNYKQLTELKEKYHDKGLRILNFPCNQFNSQMPEADGEAMVCHLKDAKADIGDVFEKINVNGDDAHPLYKYLKTKRKGTFGDSIKWNFTKFLIDKNGQPINRYAPTTKPLEIAKDIENLL